MTTEAERIARFRETLCLLVHGEPGAGKSWLGQTTPWPRLVLDAEGGSRAPKRVLPDGRVVRIKQITWDPHSQAVPTPGTCPGPALGQKTCDHDKDAAHDYAWETCRVVVLRFETVQRVYEYLNIGAHPFRSIVLDSLTEIQKRCKDSIRSGDEVLDQRMWGIMLDRMEGLVRAFRDLVFHPVKPIECVVILALTKETNYKFKPAVQGALGISLPGYVDTIGYLVPTVNAEGDDEWRMLIRPDDRYEAKDRTHLLRAHYGPVIVNPDVEQMLVVLNTETEED